MDSTPLARFCQNSSALRAPGKRQARPIMAMSGLSSITTTLPGSLQAARVARMPRGPSTALRPLCRLRFAQDDGGEGGFDFVLGERSFLDDLRLWEGFPIGFAGGG